MNANNKVTFVAVLIIISLCASSCAGIRTTEQMDAWLGSPSTELLGRWGVPDGMVETSNGSQIMTYEHVWTTYGYQSYVTCEQTFATDSNGTISQWSFSGCPKKMSCFFCMKAYSGVGGIR